MVNLVEPGMHNQIIPLAIIRLRLVWVQVNRYSRPVYSCALRKTETTCQVMTTRQAVRKSIRDATTVMEGN